MIKLAALECSYQQLERMMLELKVLFHLYFYCGSLFNICQVGKEEINSTVQFILIYIMR